MSPDPNSKTPTNPDGSHVISNRAWRIRALGQELVDGTQGTLDQAKTIIDGISVGFPGFSVVGLPLAVSHDGVKGQASEFVFAAKRAIEVWQDALNTTARTWETAESKNTMHTK